MRCSGRLTAPLNWFGGYDLHGNRLCQKELQNPTFGASVVQIIRLSDLPGSFSPSKSGRE
jgi:hypothetical protein